MSERPVRHIVTLVSPDGRFGGPTRVALDLASEQRRRGTDASVYAGADGYAQLPTQSGEVPLRLARAKPLLPRMGFAAMVAPKLRRLVMDDLTGDEIFHVHLARDLVMLPVALELRKRKLPYVIQTHGMIDASDSLMAKIVDRAMTRRAVQSASLALVLTINEMDEIERLSEGTTRSVLFENGVPKGSPTIKHHERSGALFLGRLHPRKGAVIFAQAATQLAPLFPAGTFGIAGPDEGDLENVRNVVDGSGGGELISVTGPVPPDLVAEKMGSAMVFVQPAEHEPFGMTVLEAMAQGTPPILHATSALAPAVEAAEAGWTFGTTDELTTLLARLLTHPELTRAAGLRARALAEQRFSLPAVVDQLEGLYANAR